MDARAVSRARLAITAVFFFNGVLFASMFARLPAIQDRTGVSDGALGLALLCAMLGLIVSQVAAGALVTRHGSRTIVIAGLCGWSLALLPVAFSESFAVLAAGLALIGFTNGFLDVAMNVHGLTVERQLTRPIFTGLHAGFSFGGLTGAGLAALAAAAGLEVIPQLVGAAIVTLVVAALVSRALLPAAVDAAPEGPLLAVPTRGLLALGALAFCTLLAEGAIQDWGAVYLAGGIGTSDAAAAAGLAAYSLTMGVGRLLGDGLAERIGPARLARGGGIVSTLGMALALSTSSPAPTVLGYAIAGLGLATLFPLALKAAPAHGDSTGPSVAAVAGCGYLGLLTGPPLIGGSAELAGLRGALVIVVVMCAASALLAAGVREPVRSSDSRHG